MCDVTCSLVCQLCCMLNSFVSLYHQLINLVIWFCHEKQICKDKDEAEVWFAGLKTLISRSHQRKWRTESRSDMLSSGTTSPRTYTRRSSPLSSPFSSNDSVHKVFPAIHPAHPSSQHSLVVCRSGCTDQPKLFLFMYFDLFHFCV